MRKMLVLCKTARLFSQFAPGADISHALYFCLFSPNLLQYAPASNISQTLIRRSISQPKETYIIAPVILESPLCR